MADKLPIPLQVYRRLTAALTPLAPALLSRRLKRGKEHPQRLAERRGEPGLPRPEGPLVWTHGASIGEMLSVLPLVERIAARGFAVLVTSGTVTSSRLAESRLGPGMVHQLAPLDMPRFVERFLGHWKPDLALFSESDLWPNMILGCARLRVPLIVVNGRLSARSFARWRHAPATIAALLNRFDLCLAQSARDAARFSELGAPRVTLTGNLKLDMPAPPVDPGALAQLRRAVADRPVIAAASTHAGEEAIVVDAHRRLQRRFPNLLTIIAPRHPHRGPGIADITTAAGLSAGMRSKGAMPDRRTDVYVADTIGELGLVYCVAPIVFMGGSLVRHGGQNPIEAAKLGAATLHGPHVWNFKEVYGALDEAHGTALVGDAEELASCAAAWLSDPRARRAVCDQASMTVTMLGGALERTLTAIDPYLMQLRLQVRSA